MIIYTRVITPTLLLLALCAVDVPILPVELVPEAQAIFGVRRRTAVVAYSAGKSSGAAAASASQQQAYAAQQQTAQQPASGTPLGTVMETLPAEGCVPITVGNTKYQKCDATFFRAAFMGNKLVYVAVESPL